MVESKAITLQEIVQEARENLGDDEWDYLIGGAETETTLKRNRLALDRLALVPHVLTDVSSVDTRASLLGQELRIPVFLPPIGSLQVFDPGAAASVAIAAEKFGTLTFLSSVSEPGIEATAEASSAPKVFQLYLMGDEGWMRERLERAIQAGYVGFCLTVDTQVYSRRERDLLKRYRPASGSQAGDINFQARMTWDLVEKIKADYDIPLILKGIARIEDAARACDLGVDVVYVSNHGGRQLDQGCGCVDTLPSVVAEVDGRATVVVDGGFVRGTDVVKGLALGADAVGVGRLECWALAAGGVDGVVRMLEILEHEIQVALALLGIRSIGDLDPALLQPADPVVEPHVTSAFPHLQLPERRY